MGDCYRQLQWEDRLQIEALRRAKLPVREIADIIHCHVSTVYRELHRGEYVALTSDYIEEVRYSADIAQQHYEEGLQSRGVDLKIGNEYALADYIEDRIVNDHYSPAAVAAELTRPENQDRFSMRLCCRTIYNYIDKGIFFCLSNADLPVKRNKNKRGYHKVERRQAKAPAGESISRPEEVETRDIFGHWEMDSVMGRKKSKNCLVVLTERKTRMEWIFKVSDHTAESVVDVLDHLERFYGSKRFRKIFRSITVDNGTEFAHCKDMERSALRAGRKRTKIYYCHAYSSWERGSNENANKLIRRHIPKGTDFDHRSDAEIRHIQDWINHYPRRIFGYQTSEDLFQEELKKLG